MSSCPKQSLIIREIILYSLLKDREEQVPKYKCILARIEIQLMIIYAVRLNPFTNILPISGMQ